MTQSETNSQDVLRDDILADARRQAERAIRKAEREAQATIDKAKAQSQAERTDKLAAAGAVAKRKHSLTLATVPVEIGRMRAARSERELISLREKVRAKLAANQGFDYGETLLTLAAEAVARMVGDTFVLELSAADRQAFGTALVAAVPDRAGRPEVKVTIGTPSANIPSGVVVRDPLGRQIWDNRLEARLDRMWPLLRSKLAEQMRPQASAEPSGGES